MVLEASCGYRAHGSDNACLQVVFPFGLTKCHITGQRLTQIWKTFFECTRRIFWLNCASKKGKNPALEKPQSRAEEHNECSTPHDDAG